MRDIHQFSHFDAVSNVRHCSFPYSYCASRAQPETQHHTHASIKTSISCETSTNFHTLTHSQTSGIAASPIVTAHPETRQDTHANLKTTISCETSSNFDTCHEMPRLPRNLHVVATARSRANAICEKHSTRHV